MTPLKRVMSTRYIFLLSGLVFILWSLATSLAPKSSVFSALFQLDLDESIGVVKIEATGTNWTTTGSSDVNSPEICPQLGIARTHIYVISLAGRQDRRAQMEFLRTTQDLAWTVVDAVPANATLVHRILEIVALHRAESEAVGSSRFRWPEDINALSITREPLKALGSDTWHETPLPSNQHASNQLDPLARSTLGCAIDDDWIPTLVNDTPGWMTLSPAKVACWHSHVSAIRRFVEEYNHHHGDDVAVILEDDIDMEKDISARLSQLWPFLPSGWDIVFLGHCWSNEASYPSLTTFKYANLFPSRSPKCTHAYALSRPGARRLLQHLRYPPFAYSRALDQAYAWLVWSGRLRSYSIVPSLVVQRKSASSDISPGPGSEWRESLREGVFQA